MISTPISSQAEKVSAILDTVDRLSRKYARSKKVRKDTKALFDLYGETLTLCRSVPMLEQKSIRSIHHLSCTGGTLISKCLAAMPNTRVLNEIDPLSQLLENHDQPAFTPTDFISLVRQSDHHAPSDLIVDLFLNNLKTVLPQWSNIGLKAVLRDHAHSQFLSDNEALARPTLHQILCKEFKPLSIVTVRDPVDSFLSLKKNGWIHFERRNFDEYCRRYLLFLDSHRNIPLFRYEDFASDPKGQMQKICRELELEFQYSFIDTFNYFHFSGDSGRKGNTIALRARRPIDDVTSQEIAESQHYPILAVQLGYEIVKQNQSESRASNA